MFCSYLSYQDFPLTSEAWIKNNRIMCCTVVEEAYQAAKNRCREWAELPTLTKLLELVATLHDTTAFKPLSCIGAVRIKAADAASQIKQRQTKGDTETDIVVIDGVPHFQQLVDHGNSFYSVVMDALVGAAEFHAIFRSASEELKGDVFEVLLGMCQVHEFYQLSSCDFSWEAVRGALERAVQIISRHQDPSFQLGKVRSAPASAKNKQIRDLNGNLTLTYLDYFDDRRGEEIYKQYKKQSMGLHVGGTWRVVYDLEEFWTLKEQYWWYSNFQPIYAFPKGRNLPSEGQTAPVNCTAEWDRLERRERMESIASNHEAVYLINSKVASLEVPGSVTAGSSSHTNRPIVISGAKTPADRNSGAQTPTEEGEDPTDQNEGSLPPTEVISPSATRETSGTNSPEFKIRKTGSLAEFKGLYKVKDWLAAKPGSVCTFCGKTHDNAWCEYLGERKTKIFLECLEDLSKLVPSRGSQQSVAAQSLPNQVEESVPRQPEKAIEQRWVSLERPMKMHGMTFSKTVDALHAKGGMRKFAHISYSDLDPLTGDVVNPVWFDLPEIDTRKVFFELQVIVLPETAEKYSPKFDEAGVPQRVSLPWSEVFAVQKCTTEGLRLIKFATSNKTALVSHIVGKNHMPRQPDDSVWRALEQIRAVVTDVEREEQIMSLVKEDLISLKNANRVKELRVDQCQRLLLHVPVMRFCPCCWLPCPREFGECPRCETHYARVGEIAGVLLKLGWPGSEFGEPEVEGEIRGSNSGAVTSHRERSVFLPPSAYFNSLLDEQQSPRLRALSGSDLSDRDAGIGHPKQRSDSSHNSTHSSDGSGYLSDGSEEHGEDEFAFLNHFAWRPEAANLTRDIINHLRAPVVDDEQLTRVIADDESGNRRWLSFLPTLSWSKLAEVRLESGENPTNWDIRTIREKFSILTDRLLAREQNPELVATALPDFVDCLCDVNDFVYRAFTWNELDNSRECRIDAVDEALLGHIARKSVDMSLARANRIGYASRGEWRASQSILLGAAVPLEDNSFYQERRAAIEVLGPQQICKIVNYEALKSCETFITRNHQEHTNFKSCIEFLGRLRWQALSCALDIMSYKVDNSLWEVNGYPSRVRPVAQRPLEPWRVKKCLKWLFNVPVVSFSAKRERGCIWTNFFAGVDIQVKTQAHLSAISRTLGCNFYHYRHKLVPRQYLPAPRNSDGSSHNSSRQNNRSQRNQSGVGSSDYTNSYGSWDRQGGGWAYGSEWRNDGVEWRSRQW